MPPLLCRRAFLAGLATAAGVEWASADERLKSARERLAAIEASEGGRLGVMAVDTGDRSSIERRGDERFPMCSTFKLLAAAAALKRVDGGAERLDRRIAYGPHDVLEYAPVTRHHLAEGGMALGDLCAAAIEWSDNTAANLILGAIGGPAGWTAFARSLGDPTSRLDRNEPDLNTAIPGDDRDSTTPRVMAADVEKVVLGNVLSTASRAQLEAWLAADQVGGKRLRAGLPASWRVGDKTGTGGHGTANVIGILRPPGRAPIIAAVYFTDSAASQDRLNAIHKEVGALIAATF
jgi:beta-lactamase class A